MSPIIFLVLACAPSEVEVHKIEEDTLATEATDQSIWDFAELEVLSPASGDFLPLGEANTFSARIIDADGNDLGFEEIGWHSDIDEAWVPVGTTFDDLELAIGTHTLTATAELPNGDRLSHSLGGILVQSIYAGTYAGSLTVATEYDGYAFACTGSTTLVVDQNGEEVNGNADCHLLLSISGFELELDLAYISYIVNEEGLLGGNLSADVYGYELPVDFTGTLTEDGVMEGGFESDLMGFILAGELSADRISRDTEGVQ